MLDSREHGETSNESLITLQGTSSFSEHIVSNASITHDKNLQRRNHDKAQRGRLTPEQREEMNAWQRAARRNKTNEERNASQRAARKKKWNSRRGKRSTPTKGQLGKIRQQR